VDENWTPEANTVLVFVKTFTGNGLETTIFLVTERDPLFRHTAIVLGIIKGLEGEPVSWVLSWVSVIDSLKNKNTI
jgi:hypothetical protein